MREIFHEPRIEGIYLLLSVVKSYNFKKREWVSEEFYYVGESIDVRARFWSHRCCGTLSDARMILLQETKLKKSKRCYAEQRFIGAAVKLGLTIVNGAYVRPRPSDLEVWDLTEEIKAIQEARVLMEIENGKILTEEKCDSELSQLR